MELDGLDCTPQADVGDAAETGDGGSIRLLVSLPSGRLLPVKTPIASSVGEVKVGGCRRCGFPDTAEARMGLALGHAGLDEARSVGGNDLREGDVVTLFERT